MNGAMIGAGAIRSRRDDRTGKCKGRCMLSGIPCRSSAIGLNVLGGRMRRWIDPGPGNGIPGANGDIIRANIRGIET